MFRTIFSKSIAGLTFIAVIAAGFIAPTTAAAETPISSNASLLSSLPQDGILIETKIEKGVEHEYQFDTENEIVTLTTEDGYKESITFDELAELAAGLVGDFISADEGASFLEARGLDEYVPSQTVTDSTYLQSHPWCATATKIAGALNTVAWRALAAVIGMHPLVRLVTVGGHSAFWAWVRSNC